MPHSTSRSRHARSRRFGAIGALISLLLTPAGMIVATLASATLAAGALTLLRTNTQPPAPFTPEKTHPVLRGATAAPTPPVTTHIESDGETLPIVLAEGGQLDSAFAGPGSSQRFVSLGLPSDPVRPHALSSNTPSLRAQDPAVASPSREVTPAAVDPQIVLSARAPSDPSRPTRPTEPPLTHPPASKDTPPPERTPGASNPTLQPTQQHAEDIPPESTVTSTRTVPEPPVLGLMLLGLTALIWNARSAR